MKTIDLNGKWFVRKSDSDRHISALVPGDIYADLLREKEIPDPFYRDNEKQLQWIGESDWIYTREFEITEEQLKSKRIILHCDGLDTLAEIKINGSYVAKTENMFRTYEFDVKTLLNLGKNLIEVYFSSAVEYVKEKQKTHKLSMWGNSVGFDENWTYHKQLKVDAAEGWIRKEPCNFGWDWGIMAVTCGIWRDIKLLCLNTGRITDTFIMQKHSKNKVVLNVKNEYEIIGSSFITAEATVSLNGIKLSSQKSKVINAKSEFEFTITESKLWWPSGMGEQPLYNIEIKLLDDSGNIIDSVNKHIGLRIIKLERNKDQWGESFYFSVNGISLFAKGANWIPADGILGNLEKERYFKLIKSAKDANMNMLRVWGGGIYEDEAFYKACDELGILVWHDFMFACSTYPTFDKSFMENVKHEIVDNVKRIRHHACLALWCGNNELEQGQVSDSWGQRTMPWEDYSRLFDKMIPEIVKELSPETDYWPSSPHTPVGDRKDFNNVKSGDAHLWDVWHGKKPFEWYRTTEHRFVSEFGFQSFPEPKTAYKYTDETDRSVTSYVMEHHQRTDIGNSTIMFYMLDWFRLPVGFENTLWLSQIQQGLAIKYAVEHWRRHMPKCMGSIYWQHNDTWPVASWASLDYYGRWKALHYIARNFYSQIIISGVENKEKSQVEIHVTSDLLESVPAKAKCIITNLEGNILLEEYRELNTPVQCNLHVQTVSIKDILKTTDTKNLLVWLELEKDGKIIAENLVHFEKPKHMIFKKPEVKAEVKKISKKSYEVLLSVSKTALWTWLELKDYDTVFSDNFIHLRPGIKKSIYFDLAEDLSESEINNQLTVKSLFDTY